MEWEVKELDMVGVADSAAKVVPIIGSIKGLLLGAAASPLLLVSIYFFKASPRFFSKEHTISLLLYVCSVLLASIGVIWYGLSSVVAAFQILPLLNQIFVSSFAFKIESFVSVCLSGISIYFAIIGHRGTTLVVPLSWVAVVGFLAVLGLTLWRMTASDRGLARRIEEMKISDLWCTIFFSLEAAIGFAAICSFSSFLHLGVVLFGGLTSMCFLVPMEKALYFYPATAVIPIFTICFRIVAELIAMQSYTGGSNFFIAISLVTGILSALFPLILF
ncbi:hypothetical protein NEHOM01_1052 [Nematocida homosporus]|uniref:uncharacterized protein n=1 Tax=Nematocida homosporus TaxID=1912981 RepID=UPI00221F4ECC|nr:uncharacterized protein NEHOM01_1052 [Nematocida homosporus]KAI5185775.1 hypothetical protein NEHOM01_1052 [Nematocida homosporus]